MKNHFEKYLNFYAEKGPWKVIARSPNGIRNAVVIPALAEYPEILETLHSLALNDPEELKRTLVVCVVNNRPYPHVTEEAITNNRDTISMLDALMQRSITNIGEHKNAACIQDILDSNIRLAYVDASSPGFELPANGGVGLARKIGMDFCLPLFKDRDVESNLLFSLDADTLVEPNYLKVAVRHFRRRNRMAAVFSFLHRISNDRSVQEAIDFYESYLRYYVIGLYYANSPYAFHTIGSTIVSSAEGYVTVRGIPKRLAAEDFYFLNKLAKIGPIGHISETTVFPSPRLSARTPFGTGNKIGELIQKDEMED
ncbi:MAG: hypothetical protein JW902_03825, partial [Syntrophaceae bacterium]|nr:hypothetical protein [Syntrophaceae bacterium]